MNPTSLDNHRTPQRHGAAPIDPALLGRPIHWADYQTLPRPVSMICLEYPATRSITVPLHAHPRAQLALSTRGSYVVEAQGRAWQVPPWLAFWIPGGVPHAMNGRGEAITTRSLYVDERTCPRLPTQCCVLAVSPLLRELVQVAMHFPLLWDENGREGRVMGLIVDEIAEAAQLPLDVPMPADAALAAVCRTLIAEPGRDDDVAEWAASAHLSERTFTRRFREETGLGFSLWRQRLRASTGLARLHAGVPVSQVAYELGYDSPSAFGAMFRKLHGCSPTAALKRAG